MNHLLDISWASELSMAPKLCEEIWLDRDNHSSEVRALNIYYKQTDASDQKQFLMYSL